MNKMNNKICLVTGATQGLGAAIAHRLASAGAEAVYITGRNQDRGEAVANSIMAKTSSKSKFIAADFSSVEDCRAAIGQCETDFGRIDVLVNAGAFTDRGTILDTTPELFDQLFAVNVRGPYFLMQEAIKLMIRTSVEGSICNIGSISSEAGQPFINAYCASKGALTTLTKNTAFSVMANRIRVNQLNVGWMASDHELKIQAVEAGDANWMEKATEGLPFGRLVDPEEAARAVNFIVSSDAGLMTGSVINFDQSVWGAASGVMPVPVGPMTL